MAAPSIPWSTRPVLTRGGTNVPSFKYYMVAKLLRGTRVNSTEALRVYDTIRTRVEEACALNRMEGLCPGASESALSFLIDKLFWLAHWPQENYPREGCSFTRDDTYAIIMARARMRVHQTSRDRYIREARAWSKSLGEKLTRMVERP